MQVCTPTVYELSSRRLTIGQTDRRPTIQILQPQQRQHVDQQVTCVTHDHGTESANTDLLPTVYMLLSMPVLLLSVLFKSLTGEDSTDAGADLCSMFYLDGYASPAYPKLALLGRFYSWRKCIER
jgi:hypothetical protein